MPNPTSQKRLTETFAGRAAALLLALIWLASMGMTDINAYSYLPTMAGLIVVVLLALSAMIRGARTVQLPWLAWCSLAIGGYFLARCLCSFDVVGSWREAGLILSCGVFYVAGIYAAQGRSLKPAVGVLLAAVLLHIVYFYLMKYTDLPLEWTGRPSFGPGGVNHRPVTLFVYKNQAGAFLMISGALLVASAWWSGSGKRIRLLVICAIGVASIVLSDACGTRSVLLLAPVLVSVALALWVVLKISSENKISVGVIFCCVMIFVGIGCFVCAVLFDSQLASWTMAIDTHDRYRTWGACCRFLHDAPPWGYGSNAVRWLLAPCYADSREIVNYAHNEYLQAWVDYGFIGLGGMLFIISSHMVRGSMVLLSPRTASVQKNLTALALLCVCGWAVASFVDFFWHHVSLASMTAFCAGVLASPFPRERRGRLIRVQVQGGAGKGFTAMLSCAIIAVCSWLVAQCAPVWGQQWLFARLSAPEQDEDGAQRLAIINSLLPQYPSHRLADTAYLLPGNSVWKEEEEMLLRVLKSNPRQLFMVAMLSRLYTEQGRYSEADALCRRYFPGDGLPLMGNSSWPYYYYDNLMHWGQYCMLHGDLSGAYSRMRYASAIYDRAGLYKVSFRPYDILFPTPEQNKYRERYLSARRQDIKLFETLGIEPDDSWMQPMEPGGKPALYRRYGLPDAAEREKVAEQERYSWRLLRQNP